MVSRWDLSVHLSEPTTGHILGRHILDTSVRVCFIPSITIIKMRDLLG